MANLSVAIQQEEDRMYLTESLTIEYARYGKTVRPCTIESIKERLATQLDLHNR